MSVQPINHRNRVSAALPEKPFLTERIAIDSYAEMVRYIGEKDPTTRRLLEGRRP